MKVRIRPYSESEIQTLGVDLKKEILTSMPHDEIFKEKEVVDELDIKFIVNGVEFDPLVYNNIIENIDGYILKRAETLLMNKFILLQNRLNAVNVTIDELCEGIELVNDDYIES